jgi:hypothetical protein
MNHSLYSADRSTHLKIVAVALIAGASILGYGVAVRSKGDGSAFALQNIQVIPRPRRSADCPHQRWSLKSRPSLRVAFLFVLKWLTPSADVISVASAIKRSTGFINLTPWRDC